MRAIIFALLVPACGEAPPEPRQIPQHVAPDRAPPQAPALPRPIFQLLPDDLATDVRGMAPVLLVSVDLTPADQRAVEEALLLVRWPSRERVEASIELQRRDPSAGLIVSRFSVVPPTMLAEGWYALALDLEHMPPALLADARVASSPWPGHLVTRFATHRATIVSALSAERSAERSEVRARFSTRVRDTRSGAEIVHVSDGERPLGCAAQNDLELQSSDGTYEIVLHCPPILPLVVTVDPTLRSLDGVALGDTYGGPVELEAAADPRLGADAITRTLHL